MRTLTFTADSDEYRLLHQASLASSFQPKGRKQYDLVGEVQERLESIGEPISEKTDGDGMPFYHCPQGGTVTFEEAEFEVLMQLVEGTSFVNAVSRRVSKLYKLLDASQKETPQGPTLVK